MSAEVCGVLDGNDAPGTRQGESHNGVLVKPKWFIGEIAYQDPERAARNYVHYTIGHEADVLLSQLRMILQEKRPNWSDRTRACVSDIAGMWTGFARWILLDLVTVGGEIACLV